MTATEFIDRLAELVAAGRDREALAFSARHREQVMTDLDAEQASQLISLLKSAHLALDLAEWEESSRGAEAAAGG